MSGVSSREPTPQEARAAVAEIGQLKATVQNADRLFRPTLLAFAAASVGLRVAMVVLPAVAGVAGSIAVNLVLIAAVALVVLTQRRQRAYSRRGNLVFRASLLSWVVWTALVTSWTYNIVWSVPLDQLQRDLYWVASALVSIVPLILGAIVVGRRR